MEHKAVDLHTNYIPSANKGDRSKQKRRGLSPLHQRYQQPRMKHSFTHAVYICIY